MLVAVDPSIVSCGLAIFDDQDELVEAYRVKSTLKATANIGARVWDMAFIVGSHVPESEYGFVDVVTEWPQIYRAQHAKGDPNDLPGVAAVGLAVAAYLRARSCFAYTPKEWAGNVPKATRGDCKASPRAHRIAKRLSESELKVWNALKKSDHDAIDAIGIGLYHLGRFSAQRHYSGAKP